MAIAVEHLHIVGAEQRFKTLRLHDADIGLVKPVSQTRGNGVGTMCS